MYRARSKGRFRREHKPAFILGPGLCPTSGTLLLDDYQKLPYKTMTLLVGPRRGTEYLRASMLLSCSNNQYQSRQPAATTSTAQSCGPASHGEGLPGRQIGYTHSPTVMSSSSGKPSSGGPGRVGTMVLAMDIVSLRDKSSRLMVLSLERFFN